jgi:diguanylate cyclase (GGDEF)-like protein/PAS domain S-box-containing protein
VKLSATIPAGDEATPDTLEGALARLRDAETRWRRLVENSPVVTYVADFDAIGTLRYVSPQIEALLGRSAEEFIADQAPGTGGLWERLIHPEDRDRVIDATRGAFERDEEFEVEYRMAAADGRTVHVLERDVIIRDDDGTPRYTQGVVLDVTALREAEQALKAERDRVAHLAFHDPLTGLPNRTLLNEHLELALARARREGRSVAVLYLDLDDFKVVNDSLGHGAGDELLKLVAERLSRRRREADLLSRQGGDEFLLLLTDLEGDPLPPAMAAAEGMLAALAAPFRLGDTEFHVGGSIGVSLYPRDASDAETLLAHADAAMYEAKGTARGDVRAWTGRDAERGAERLWRATRLRHAIQRDELVLHFQPIHRALDGRVRGVEALVRWEDPERGLVMPADFVPLAEETGLIEHLGAWVVDAACAQAAEWRAEGIDVVTGINVSARELRRADWARYVLGRLDANGVPPEALLVELTETTAMRGHGRIEEQLRDLHEAGVQVAIDDFGTGWSSLHRLRRLPVGMLKLDRSFLAGVPEGAEASAVVRAILELGAALGKVVVAEGVETQRQLDFLVGQGCPLVQGFLLGRPEPPEALRLSESRPWRSPTTSTASSP